MQEMRPTNDLSLFNSLVGSVSDFRLCETVTNIPVPAEELTEECLYIMDLSRSGINGMKVQNKGSQGVMEFSNDPSFIWVHFELGEFGSDSKLGTYSVDRTFDGIACDDGHLTPFLGAAPSSLRFNTPDMDDWLSEATVEFWIRPTYEDFYN